MGKNSNCATINLRLLPAGSRVNRVKSFLTFHALHIFRLSAAASTLICKLGNVLLSAKRFCLDFDVGLFLGSSHHWLILFSQSNYWNIWQSSGAYEMERLVRWALPLINTGTHKTLS